MAVTRAGVMEPYANHTFQPRTVVRRADLAQVVSRLLDIVAPESVAAWRAARTRFADVADTHLAYPAASNAVASGVMAPSPDGTFQPSRVVTGAEAVQAIERLRALAQRKGPTAPRR
jgi:hypothetical protein